MCDRHQILDFIEARLDDSFPSKMVWDRVWDHHWGEPPMFIPGYYYQCIRCQSETYPCPSLLEVASYWSDDEDFDPDWTQHLGKGNINP